MHARAYVREYAAKQPRILWLPPDKLSSIMIKKIFCECVLAVDITAVKRKERPTFP